MKKLFLEFIRGTAALTVLFYHFFELHTLSNHSKHFYFGNWGTDAVIIFFVLSGIVINISQSANPRQAADFIFNRFIRLYPQLAFGLVLGILVLLIINADIPSAGVITGNFMMISAVKDYMVNIVPSIASNSPIWSLSYEMAFYLLFAVTIGRYQKRAIFSWLLIAIAATPLYYLQIGPDVVKHFVAVLSFSLIWLAGYYIYEYRESFYAGKFTALFSVGMLPLVSRMHMFHLFYDPVKYLLFAVCAAPFFRYCLQVPKSGRKINLYYYAIPYVAIVYIVFNQPYLTFTSFMAYSALPFVLIAFGWSLSILKLKMRFINFIKGTGALLGKYSFSIYIIHYPVLFLCASFFTNAAINLAIALPAIAFIAYGLETYLQTAVIGYIARLKVNRRAHRSKFGPSILHWRVFTKWVKA